MTVIAKLHGGLGNQMFQYAAARALAHRLAAEVCLDVTEVTGNSMRQYALDAFNIRAEVGTADEMMAFHPQSRGQSLPFIRALRRSLLGYGAYTVYREKHFHYDPTFVTLHGDVYLDGYWQSERYFADIEAELRREFEFRASVSDEYAWLVNRLAQPNSVSVHVRRGDYVSDPAISRLHGAVDFSYYLRAANIIAERCAKPSFFVFSDDSQWVRENFHLQAPFELVAPDMTNPAEDLRLMSLCAHHIISNSTFSWWGAWLANHRNQIVVAPKRWFATDEHDTRDIVPERWITV